MVLHPKLPNSCQDQPEIFHLLAAKNLTYLPTYQTLGVETGQPSGPCDLALLWPYSAQVADPFYPHNYTFSRCSVPIIECGGIYLPLNVVVVFPPPSIDPRYIATVASSILSIMAETASASAPAVAPAAAEKKRPEKPNAELFNERLAKAEKEHQETMARYVCRSPQSPTPCPLHYALFLLRAH